MYITNVIFLDFFSNSSINDVGTHTIHQHLRNLKIYNFFHVQICGCVEFVCQTKMSIFSCSYGDSVNIHGQYLRCQLHVHIAHIVMYIGNYVYTGLSMQIVQDEQITEQTSGQVMEYIIN